MRVPQREFAFSYLIYPTDYEKDILGVSIPLSFSTVDKEGYVINYLPFSYYLGLTMTQSWLADRDNRLKQITESLKVIEAEHSTEVLAEKHEIMSADNLDIEGHKHLLTSADNLDIYGEKHTLMDADNLDIEGEKHTLMDAQNKDETVAEKHVIWSADNLDIEGYNHKLSLGDNITEHHGEIATRFDTAAKYIPIKEMLIMSNAPIALQVEEQKAAELVMAAIQMEKYTPYKEMSVDYAVLAEEFLERRNGLVMKVVHMIDEVWDREAHIMDTTLLTDRNRRDGNLMTRILDSVNTGRNSSIMKKVLFSNKGGRGSSIMARVVKSDKARKGVNLMKKVIRGIKHSKGANRMYRWRFADKIKRGAIRMHSIKFSKKDGRGSRRMTRVIMGLNSPNEALIDKKVYFGHSEKSVEGFLNHDVIFARYHSKEAAINKAVMFMEKSEIAGKVIDAILESDGKNERDAFWDDAKIFAETKAEHDARIEEIQTSSIKKARDGLINLLVQSFNKRARESEWVERTILAILSDSTREALIDRLVELGDDISRDSILKTLEEAEIPDREALVQELELAWNKDKPNRPAGMMLQMKQGWWDVGFDDLMESWDPGWDYLDPPSSDYNYDKHKAEVYDVNGVPIDPIGPINLADVDVKMPINHPHKEWEGIGKDEAWVELWTYQDMLITIAGIWKRETSRIAGMTGHQALQEILKQLHDNLHDNDVFDKQYQRMFRFIRWHAERITHQDSVTVLHRVYEPWRDAIISNGGVFTHPHTIDQMVVQPTGVIESTSTMGSLEFGVENYIDGQITFSTSLSSGNPSSVSELRLLIDGVLTHTFTVPDGVQRLSFDVPMGNHQYKLEYNAEVGDIIRVSGIQVTGVKFVEAHTTQRDAGTLRGMKAVDHLIQSLLKYYNNHHKNKSKGATGVYQRKIWLS
jgi:hypothetical protein